MAETTSDPTPEWTFSDDPDDLERDDIFEKDVILSTIIDITVGDNDESAEGRLGITMSVAGSTVSGTIVSQSVWLQAVVDQFGGTSPTFEEAISTIGKMAREGREQRNQSRLDRELPTLARRFIHLIDVTIFDGTSKIFAPTWRGRLEHVSGWSLGTGTQAGQDEQL